MKVKFLLQQQNESLEEFEERVNDWLEDREEGTKIVDVKHFVTKSEKGPYVFTEIQVMVIYEYKGELEAPS